MWWLTMFVLCSLLISFLTSFIILVSDILSIKYYKTEFHSKEFIKFSLLGLIPVLNIMLLGCSIIDICSTLLNGTGITKFMDKFVTDLIKGEK